MHKRVVVAARLWNFHFILFYIKILGTPDFSLQLLRATAPYSSIQAKFANVGIFSRLRKGRLSCNREKRKQ